ncbi:MAG: hypothetical protein WD024_05820 [Bacillota bacterium]
MSERVTEDTMERLEVLAACYYPGQFVLIDERVDDLMGKPGLRASLVASASPGLTPEVVRTVAMVSFGSLGMRPLPESWRQVLECSKNRPWRVNLYVQRSDVAKIRSVVREMRSDAEVIALPHDARKALLLRSVNVAAPLW